MSPDDLRHGTEAGHTAHHRAGVPACRPCLDAHMRNNKLRSLASTPPRKVSSLGSRRRIRALQAIGWGRERIAREAGYDTGAAFVYVMKSDTILAVTAARIAEAYERLSMVRPIGPGPDRARTWAKRHGYFPPLAWDDIDDPDEIPATGWKPVRNRTAVELFAELDHLLGLGVSEWQAAKQLGVSIDAIEKARERAGRVA